MVSTVNGPDPALDARAQGTYAAILRGELGGVAETMLLLAERTGVHARSWHAAIGAAAWMLDPERFTQPDVEIFETALEAEPRARGLVALALTHLERHALVTFDAVRLDRLINLHEQLLAGAGAGQEAELWLEAGRAWLALLRGEAGGLDERAQVIEKHALALEDRSPGHRCQRGAGAVRHPGR